MTASKFPMVPLGDVLDHFKEYIDAPEAKMYPKLSVRLYGKGVVLDAPADGTNLKMKRHQIAKAGQVILSEIWGKKGAIGFVPPEGDGALCTSHFFLFDLRRDKIEPGYLQAIFTANYLEDQLNSEAKGTTGYAAVRPKHLMAASIPLPPLEEQRRIVARIEELAAKIDEARVLKFQALRETDSLFASYRAQAFEAALSVGTIRFDEAALLERGRFSHRPRNDPRFFGGDYPWIQIAEIEAADKHITRWSQSLNEDGLAISRKFPRGTVLLSIAATIGAVGILDFDCCVPDSVVAATPNQGISRDLIYHYIGFLRSRLEALAPQSAQKNVNLKILAPLPFPAIEFHRQEQLASELDRIQGLVSGIKALLHDSAVEMNALLPSILNKAFVGEL